MESYLALYATLRKENYTSTEKRENCGTKKKRIDSLFILNSLSVFCVFCVLSCRPNKKTCFEIYRHK